MTIKHAAYLILLPLECLCRMFFVTIFFITGFIGITVQYLGKWIAMMSTAGMQWFKFKSGKH